MDVKKKTRGCVLIVALLCESCGAVDQKSVMEGGSGTLNTDVLKPTHDTILWYFNNITIAEINGHPNTSCLYDGPDGRFRDRLKVDYGTGSLIITNITSQHAGRYEAEIISREGSGKNQHLNRKHRCNRTKIIRKVNNVGVTKKTINLIVDKGTSPLEQGSGYLGVTIGVTLLLVMAAGAVTGAVFYYRHRKRKAERQNKRKPDDVRDILMQDMKNKPEEV